MKRIISTGLLLTAAGVSGLMAQQAPSAGQPAQGQAAPAQGQPAQGQAQQQQVPGAKSAGESQAVIALFTAAQSNNVDGIIKNAEELVTKYADTIFKEQAYYLEAAAYQQKGDADKAQIYAERVLTENPKNFQAALMVGELLAQRTRENDLDREEKLTKATKLLGDTITSLQTAPKPNPQLPDAQWEEGKKYMMAQAHSDLGLVALTRKKYDVAITEFKAANDLDAQPAYQVRMASAYQNAGKNEEALALVNKLLADPQLHPTIKSVAENIKTAASQGKK